MSYNKRLIIAIIAILCIQESICGALKETVSSLSYITEPLRTNMKKHLQKISNLPAMQQMKQYTSHTRYAMDTMYAPFRHPFYKNFIEPIAAAQKAPIWRHQMKEEWTFRTMNIYDRFEKFKYIPWKNALTLDQKEEHKEAIENYEKAYDAYKTNPHDITIEKEFLENMQRIHQIMTTPHQTTTQDHVLNDISQ